MSLRQVSALQILNGKFFLPKFLSILADFIYYLLFSHIFVRRAGFRHQTTDFFQLL